MSKIRINELARQLEVKSREVIDKLHELGIAESLTHSSSIDDDSADKLRRYYNGDTSVISPPRKAEPEAAPVKPVVRAPEPKPAQKPAAGQERTEPQTRSIPGAAAVEAPKAPALPIAPAGAEQ